MSTLSLYVIQSIGFISDIISSLSLWPILRNLAPGVLTNSADLKLRSFRGETKFVVIIWR